ncbi:hypothetical protein [Deinococcus radiotolerans]|uniref:Uncharacterized protein n=1 Tax=Deinococcus radiotolerans TaxID=1309407 RepID=A0ABQ2FQ78_9DEIO|nr:hypothetical protein [Deinococcus radiotolerans]GGL15872.1 hypothetical protein GCM10010844_38470 [Deinococcus radiotolerans]
MPKDQKEPPTSSERAAFETHLTDLPAWQVAALKAHTRWPEGREVTAAEFQAALKAALGEVIA